jgi:hypothetical protein
MKERAQDDGQRDAIRHLEGELRLEQLEHAGTKQQLRIARRAGVGWFVALVASHVLLLTLGYAVMELRQRVDQARAAAERRHACRGDRFKPIPLPAAF